MRTETAKPMDHLAGIGDYERFLDALTATLEAAGEKGPPVVLALIDLDWFGKYNAEAGKEAGDRVLARLSELLGEHFASQGQVFRYGGDAFALLLQDVEKETVFLQLEALRKTFAGEAKEANPSLSISVGLAAYPEDGARENELIRRMNEALYRAKVSGRDRICLARAEKMVTKTSHYGQGQLEGLSRLAKREGVHEAALLREALDDLLRKYNN